jgi:hypothetical protein
VEFFAEARTRLSEAELQRHVRIDNLDRWCAAIDRVLSHAGERGEVYCVWGQFHVHRELLAHGVRFTLPACPNALQWTLTAGEPGVITVHCSINRAAHDADFIDSIVGFVADWRAGLETCSGLPAARPPAGDCPLWFG